MKDLEFEHNRAMTIEDMIPVKILQEIPLHLYKYFFYYYLI